MPRPQFTLRSLLVAILAVAAFFGGMQFERELERRRRKLLDSSDLQIQVPQGYVSFVNGKLAVTFPDGDSKPDKSAAHE